MKKGAINYVSNVSISLFFVAGEKESRLKSADTDLSRFVCKVWFLD
jgi:hypothetical protein